MHEACSIGNVCLQFLCSHGCCCCFSWFLTRCSPKLCIVSSALEFTWMLIGWILFQQTRSDSYFGRVYLELQISEHQSSLARTRMGSEESLNGSWMLIQLLGSNPLSMDCILWAGCCCPVGMFVVSEDSLANCVLRGWWNIRIGLSLYLCYYQQGSSDKFVDMLHHKWQYFAWWKAFQRGLSTFQFLLCFSVWCAMISEWYRDLQVNRIFYFMLLVTF